MAVRSRGHLSRLPPKDSRPQPGRGKPSFSLLTPLRGLKTAASPSPAAADLRVAVRFSAAGLRIAAQPLMPRFATCGSFGNILHILVRCCKWCILRDCAAHAQSAEAERCPSWPKEHDWKSCMPQKGIQGSNPCLSAIHIADDPVQCQPCPGPRVGGVAERLNAAVSKTVLPFIAVTRVRIPAPPPLR